MTRSKTQAGFSLLELLVAMMIIAVLGTLGFKFVQGHAAQARYLKAQDDVRIVSQGLDQFYLRNGKYPDFGSYEAMVEPNSPLVKGNLIKTGMSGTDPFGQPYEGKSGKGSYEIKCGGDPNAPEERGPIVSTPGNMTASGPGGNAAPAGGTAKPDAKSAGPAK